MGSSQEQGSQGDHGWEREGEGEAQGVLVGTFS